MTDAAVTQLTSLAMNIFNDKYTDLRSFNWSGLQYLRGDLLVKTCNTIPKSSDMQGE